MFEYIFWNKATYLSKKHEANNIYTFIFKPEKDTTWKAGQYIDFRLEKGLVKHFTISSAPSENLIYLTTRILETPSDFKKTLNQLESGAEILISKPQGELTLNSDDEKYLFIAGGIGITPFRSILIDQTKKKSKAKIDLLYLNKTSDFAFKEELDQVSRSNANITLSYFVDKRLTAKDLEKYRDRNFFVSGTPKMVDYYLEVLNEMGIRKNRIKYDSFLGY